MKMAKYKGNLLGQLKSLVYSLHWFIKNTYRFNIVT